MFLNCVTQIDSMLLNKGTQATKTGSTTKEYYESFLAFLTYLTIGSFSLSRPRHVFSNSSQRTINVVRTVTLSCCLMCHLFVFPTFKSSVIYYSTDALQHGLYLLIRKVWEKEKWCRNKSLRRVFPQLFRVLPNFHECFCNLTETQKTCFLSSFTKHPNKKRKTSCQLWSLIY